MVGRERELELLDAAFAAAADGQGSLLLLTGEAGVGKTRLADAAASTSKLALFRAAATSTARSPYAPVAAVLRDLLRRQPAALSRSDPLIPHLALMVPELGPPSKDADRETLAVALRDAFGQMARSAPSAIFFDDLHWADAATLELLPSLAEAVGRMAAASAWRLSQRGDPARPPASPSAHRPAARWAPGRARGRATRP